MKVTDINQIITQICLCKLGSLLRTLELVGGRGWGVYILVAFKNLMGAGGRKLDSRLDKVFIFLLVLQLPRSGRDSCPNSAEGTTLQIVK